MESKRIHDFIMRLPPEYETNAGELGDTLSDGEKQRIGLSRAFLHDSDMLLLDEPTSNLDILNGGNYPKVIRKREVRKNYGSRISQEVDTFDS